MATPQDQALANRVPLDQARFDLDAKLAMADVVRGVSQLTTGGADLPREADHAGGDQRDLDEPPRWHAQPLPPSPGSGTPIAPDSPARLAATSPDVGPDTLGDEPYVRIIPAGPTSGQRTD